MRTTRRTREAGSWRNEPRLRLKGTSWAIAGSGALTVALMSAVNFAIASDFRWLLVLPAVVWLASLVLYLDGR